MEIPKIVQASPASTPRQDGPGTFRTQRFFVEASCQSLHRQACAAPNNERIVSSPDDDACHAPAAPKHAMVLLYCCVCFGIGQLGLLGLFKKTNKDREAKVDKEHGKDSGCQPLFLMPIFVGTQSSFLRWMCDVCVCAVCSFSLVALAGCVKHRSMLEASRAVNSGEASAEASPGERMWRQTCPCLSGGCGWG